MCARDRSRAAQRSASASGAASYAELVPLGIYEPPWTYPPAELALDLSYHLVYRAAAACAYALLDR